MTENLLDVENEILGWHNVHCGSGLNPIRILYLDRNENLKKVLTVISPSKVLEEYNIFNVIYKDTCLFNFCKGYIRLPERW